MLGMPANVTKGLTVGSTLVCDDNSGAKLVQIIGIKGVKPRRATQAKAGVGSVVIVSIKKGTPEMVGKVETAVVTRQKKPYLRAKERIKFEDNACVLIDDQNLPKATEIKGCIAREIVDRFPKVVALAFAVV